MQDTKKDLAASLAVALVAIPLCLGIAHASGAPLMSGLVAGIIGGILVGFFSGSHLSVTGPAAGLTTIVLAAMATLKSFPVFLTATFLAGILQIVFGKLRVGGLSRLFPSPVIKGMLAAIGLTLIFKQFPHLVGYDFESFGVMEFADNPYDVEQPYEGEKAYNVNTFTLIAHAFRHLEHGALMVGLSCLAVLYLWDARFQKRFPTLPGSLVAVVLGVGVNLVLKAIGSGWTVEGRHLVQIPPMSEGFLTFPDWSALNNPQVYVIAITIAVIASVESLLTVEALDRLDPHHRFSPPNRELVAQGIGNAACGLLGGIPVTSVVVRGSVNLSAGATSKRSTIFHGMAILLALLAFRAGLNQIPLAALAAVLVHVGAKMANPALMKKMVGRGLGQSIPFFATIVAILFSDLLIGILVGTAVSAAFILRNLHSAHGFTVTRSQHITHIRLHEEVTFFHKVRLASVLESVPEDSLVEIDGTQARTIDYDVIDLIDIFCTRAPQKKIQVVIGGIALLENISKDQLDSMRGEYRQLLDSNRAWAERCKEQDPTFFQRAGHAQKPSFFFIRCCDSRVAAETLTGMEPGKLFVHTNLANVVSPHDLNFMSALQYAVEYLNVPHIIICGHYGCTGVRSALSTDSHGLIENWVHPIKKVVEIHQTELDAISDPQEREKRIVELNVLHQVRNILETEVVQRSIRKLGIPMVHAWVFDGEQGQVKELQSNLDLEKDIHAIYRYQFSFERPLVGAGKP